MPIDEKKFKDWNRQYEEKAKDFLNKEKNKEIEMVAKVDCNFYLEEKGEEKVVEAFEKQYASYESKMAKYVNNNPGGLFEGLEECLINPEVEQPKTSREEKKSSIDILFDEIKVKKGLNFKHYHNLLIFFF